MCVCNNFLSNVHQNPIGYLPPLKAQYVVFVCVCNNFCQMSIKIQLDICPRLKAYTSVKPWLDIAPPTLNGQMSVKS